MQERIFYEQKSVSVLVIGEMAENEAFLKCAEGLCKTLHVSTNNEQILSLMMEYKIDLVFGSLSFHEYSFLPALHQVRAMLPWVEVIVFLQACDITNMDDALALKCNRYFCMKAEEGNALKHLRDGIDVISHKNIFLKDTQYFEALLDSSVVSQSDTYGNVTYINDNFTKVTGYTKEEVMGKNHRFMRHPSNDPEIFEEMWQTISSGKVWRERLLNLNKDGSDFWADTIIIPFRDEQTGKIVQYIAIRRDITEMLKEKRAIQAKEIKANEQLKLSEAKDSFLVLFTHELKTPLNAIINFSQYLHKNVHRMEEIPKEKQAYLLEQIHKSAASMLENVTNILDLSKLRNNKLHYTYTLFNLSRTVESVIEAHQALALEHKRRMRFCYDGSEVFISSDEYRFKQILSNILSNAIKYGNAVVEVSLVERDDKIEMIVEDDGKGVADKEAVFELYAQDGKGVTSMEKKGTGIGLNFVKLLCEGLNFGYKIEDSTTLGGTKFILTKTKRD